MALNDFLSKQGHTVVININDMPDKGYIRAIRVRNIVNFRLMNKEEKTEAGCPDVVVESLFGERYTITRDELLKNFVFINGKKIVIAGLKRNVRYKAMIMDNREVFYTIVPDNAVAITSQGKVSKGNVIAILSDGNGNLDKRTMGFMSLSTFKKMCVTPVTDKINKNKNKKYKLFSVYDRKLMENNKPNSYKILYSAINPGRHEMINRTNQNNTNRPIRSSTVNNTSNRGNTQNNITNANSSYKFLAVRRVVDYNNRLIGFVLRSRQGTEKALDMNTIAKLCEARQIKNLMLSSRTSNDGRTTRYIKGNGVSIETLPVERR